MQKLLGLFLVLMVTGLPVANAQQTIFNVPSQDVLDPGKISGEIDVPFRLNDPKFVAITPRIVFGCGYGFEGGLNVPGYINMGDKLWTAIAVLKHGQSLDTNAPWTVTEGMHLYVPLTSGRSAGLFGYLMTGYKVFGKLRFDGGAYAANDAVTGMGNAVGALGSIEYTVNDWLTIAVDGYSGNNALGYITPGLFVIPATNWTLYPAYQISNASRDADSYLMEIGYTF